MSNNSIVQINVVVQVAATPPTLQKTGAFVSVGGTLLAPGVSAILTQESDLTPLLKTPDTVSGITWLPVTAAAVTSATWLSDVETVTTTAPHNIPTGQSVYAILSGFSPSALNGTWLITSTGASTFTFALTSDPGSTTVEGTWAPAASAISTVASSLALVKTASNHGIPLGQAANVDLIDFAPVGYNGTWLSVGTGLETFSFPLLSNPGSVTQAGTWVIHNANELVQQAITFFANGVNQAIFVLELGLTNVSNAVANLSTYISNNPNTNYVPGATGFFYVYEVPRSWDANPAFLSLAQAYESPNSRTYFWTTTTLATYSAYTNLEKSVYAKVESPALPANQTVTCTNAVYAAADGPYPATVTFTGNAAHDILPGQWFQVVGFLPLGYNGWYLATQGTAGTTLVGTTILTQTPGTMTTAGSVLANPVANAGTVANTDEFSIAADLWRWLNYAPSSTNKVAPMDNGFIYGVTPFPVRYFNPVVSALKAAHINYTGTGAEGGISNTTIKWGTTMDGNDATYWYAADWVAINLDINTSNAVINGANNPINPLYYNQPGINALAAIGGSTLTSGVTFGLINGSVIITGLDGPVLDQNLDNGDYVNMAVLNAIPFVTYLEENPDDYKPGIYRGMSAIFMPNRGFSQIFYTVTVTELIGQ